VLRVAYDLLGVLFSATQESLPEVSVLPCMHAFIHVLYNAYLSHNLVSPSSLGFVVI
jgi:hypothetical protein